MAATTVNLDRRVRGNQPVKGYGTGVDSDEFYEGQLLAHNNVGKIAPAADTAAFKVAGVCLKRTTTAGSNTVLIEYEYDHEEWFAQDGNLVAASIGLDAVMLDDQTLTNVATATNDIRVGKIMQLETLKGVSGAWVHVGVLSTAGAA